MSELSVGKNVIASTVSAVQACTSTLGVIFPFSGQADIFPQTPRPALPTMCRVLLGLFVLSVPRVFLGLCCEADFYGVGIQKPKHIFPFVVAKPAQGSAYFILSQNLPDAGNKTRFSHPATPDTTSSRLTEHGLG